MKYSQDFFLPLDSFLVARLDYELCSRNESNGKKK